MTYFRAGRKSSSPDVPEDTLDGPSELEVADTEAEVAQAA